LAADQKYELSTQKREILRGAFNDLEMRVIKVKEKLIESVELEIDEILDSAAADQIYDAVIRVITEEVYEYSLQLARDHVSFENMIAKIEESEPQTKLGEALDNLLPNNRKLLRQKILGGIINYLRDLSEDLRLVMRAIHHNVLLNQILNLDPLLVNAQRRLFSVRRIYLDTNVVLSYLCEAHTYHKVVQEIIEASANLGVQLLVSPYTLSELENQVKRAKKNHVSLERNDIVAAMAPFGDDAILTTYVKLKKLQPSLAWEPFIAQFESWGDLLLQSNMLVENEGSDAINGNKLLGSVRKIVAENKSPFVSDNVIDHDTFNCILILHLREKYVSDEMGQVVWLLTIDRSLKKIQKLLRSAKHIENLYCMQISSWGEIVMPVENILGFVFNDFIGYLAQARLGALAEPNVIQLDFLETIKDAEVDVDRLMKMHPQQVRQILGKLQSNRDAHSILKSAATANTPESRKSYQMEFKPLLDQAVEDADPIRNMQIDYDRKINLLNQRLNLRDQTIAELNQRINQVESTLWYRVLKWLRVLFGLR
jgi:predicted nucleic acid-binding protein